MNNLNDVSFSDDNHIKYLNNVRLIMYPPNPNGRSKNTFLIKVENLKNSYITMEL